MEEGEEVVEEFLSAVVLVSTKAMAMRPCGSDSFRLIINAPGSKTSSASPHTSEIITMGWSRDIQGRLSKNGYITTAVIFSIITLLKTLGSKTIGG
jgi:hypothetical protein